MAFDTSRIWNCNRFSNFIRNLAQVTFFSLVLQKPPVAI